MKRNEMKKYAILAIALSIMNALHAQSQEDQLPVNDPTAVELDEFPGCQVAPPKDGCNARISCVGEGNILVVDAVGVREATQAASLDARRKLSQFFNDKVKAEEAMGNATKTVARSGPEGETASREMVRVTTDMVTSTTESLLQGVVTLGRLVSREDRIVQIKIGQSCKSKQAAAQGAQNIVAPGASSAGSSAPTTGGPRVFGEGAVRSTRQRAPGADNF
jgi:hypothetical protein